MNEAARSVIIRDFQPEDAEGISRLFRQIYGDLYVYPEVYLPSLIRSRNATGMWRSAVALLAGDIVAHAALMVVPSSPALAEIALTVASPAITGRGVGVRVCRLLRDRAPSFGIDMLSALLVCSHVQSQRMANPLGFATSGLLLDYLPSSFAHGTRESYVLSCLPLRACPLPDIDQPSTCRPWIDPMLARYGVRAETTADMATQATSDVRSDGELISVTLETQDENLLEEICNLPTQRIKLLRIRMASALVPAVVRLHREGYRHTGLMPTAGGGWYWLMQSGFRAGRIELHCPLAQCLFDAAGQRRTRPFTPSEHAA